MTARTRRSFLKRASLAAAGAGALAAAPVFGGSAADASLVTGPSGAGMFRSDDLADSVGVNVHMYYNDTPYADAATVTQRLVDLGIRHVRDGYGVGRADQWAALNGFAAHGIHTSLITGTVGTDPTATVADVAKNLAAAVEAIEGPNEYQYTGGDWYSRLVPFQRQLYAAVKANPTLAALPVIASSSDADVSFAADVNNLHPYPGGNMPEARIDSNVDLCDQWTQPLPIWGTETGYHDAMAASGSGVQPGTTDAQQAVYMPRLFAANLRAGLVRSYLYELVDEFVDPNGTNAEAHFGLLRHDLTPKPQAAAVKNLITLTADHPGSGYTPKPIPYLLNDAGANLRTLPLARYNHAVLLLLWRAVPAQPDGTTVPVSPVTITTTPRCAFAAAHPSVGATWASQPTGNSVTVPVDGTVTILRMTRT